ncbi:homoaconitate hydratase [Deinococcus murrayi]|uniref:LeuD/DmdB family oxidoreductase small subunit n=1 Tax=Deinococcus murrayi TaxID=68910 RepID=UPI0006868172|nr:homoaconitate hydratase [Deinococcus murrayi]
MTLTPPPPRSVPTRSARVWRFGADVNTDQIVPGRFAPYMTSEAELRKAPFIEARPEFAAQVQPGDLIVAGNNFGCGSSREYAPQALKLVGVGAIIAPSFARIFFRNALNLGIPVFEADLTDLADGERVHLDLEAARIHTAGGERPLPPPPAWMREVWRAGGIVPYYRAHGRFPGVPGR